jgi:hypothetical protein
VNYGEEEDANFPGGKSVIKYDIEIPGVDVEGPEASSPQSVEINNPDISKTTPIQFR